MNAISVVLGLALVASAHAQVAHVIPNYFLDLTIPSAAPTGVPRLAGGTGGSSNSQFQSLPIVLFLDHVETGRLTTEVTYQVTLRNVGDGPLTLPWSTDFAAIESFGQQPSLATLNLRILDNTLRLHRIGTIVLGGTSRVAGSTIVLKPNEIAVIKAKGLITLAPTRRRQLASQSARDVKAEFSLQPQPPIPYSILESVNAVPRVFTGVQGPRPPRQLTRGVQR